MIHRIAAAALALALALTAPAAVASGDPEAGKIKADAVCAACHGAAGISISNQFPNLAGQYADYLVQSLKQYANGQRKNAVMLGFASQLSEQEMKDLAAWYASQKGLSTWRQN